MAIDFANLFTLLGRIGKVAYVSAQDQAAVASAITAANQLNAKYYGYLGNAANPFSAAFANAAALEPFLIAQGAAIPASLAALAQSTLVEIVRLDVPSVNSVSAAAAELVRQMKAAGESVKQATVSVSQSPLAGNTGTGVLVLTAKRGDGLDQQNLIAEVARLVCAGDAQSGTATAGREPFRLAGAPTQGLSVWDYQYPAGSGAAATVTATDPTQDASSGGNLSTNGDFEDWSAVGVVPAGWTLGVGAINVDLVRTATSYDGSYAAQFTAGANLTEIYEDVTALVSPLTSYALNLWAKKSGTITSGVFRVALVDGSGTVINDDAGNANSFALGDGTLSTTYAAKSGVFRTPRVMPSAVRLQLKVTTALAGANVLADRVCCRQVAAPYPGGPGLAIFSGATPFVQGDGYDVTTANDRGGSTYLATFQALFDRLFGTRQMGLLLPYAGVPTRADTLITS